MFRNTNQEQWMAIYKGNHPGVTAETVEELAEMLEEKYGIQIQFSEEKKWRGTPGDARMKLVATE